MKCIKCGETKLEMFYPSSIQGSDYRCKKCIYSELKAYRELHKEQFRVAYNKYKKKYYSKYAPKIKTDILMHYSNGLMYCAECGATTNLSIDHINGNGSKHRLSLGLNSSHQFYLWLKRNNYPAGYRVLCIHCNSHIKSSKGRKCQPTSKLVKRALRMGLFKSKDIVDWGQSSNLTRRALLEALRRLTKSNQIERTGRGLYRLI